MSFTKNPAYFIPLYYFQVQAFILALKCLCGIKLKLHRPESFKSKYFEVVYVYLHYSTAVYPRATRHVQAKYEIQCL